MTSTLQPGLDISHHDYDAGRTSTKAKWDAINAAGIKFVFAKALERGSGVGGTDSAWAFHRKQLERLDGDIVKGAYCWLHNDGNEATQADTFLGLLSDDSDPTGWLCAIDVEGNDGFAGEAAPNYASVARFAKAFWKQAPGHPLFLYTRKTYWNRVSSPDKDAKALGLTLWNACYPLRDSAVLGNCVDGTDLGTINITAFDTSATKLAFGWYAKAPYAGNYAGFTGKRAAQIVQWGGLKITGVGTFDGDAFNGTMAQLRAYTRVAEPVLDVTVRPGLFLLDITSFPPSSITASTTGISAFVTPDLFLLRITPFEAKAGLVIEPGTGVLVNANPTGTITGGV